MEKQILNIYSIYTERQPESRGWRIMSQYLLELDFQTVSDIQLNFSDLKQNYGITKE
jgi:hypothetical protein